MPISASARATKLASDLRKDLGIDQRVFDLGTLVREMGIHVTRTRLPAGLEGVSLYSASNDVETILLSDSSGSAERERFTLAHELGHVLLSHAATGCGASSIHGTGLDDNEREANSFAASLLMPAALFREDVKTLRPEFTNLRSIASSYQVSLTAASLRFLHFTADGCVLLWFTGSNRAAWFQRNDAAGRWFVRTDLPSGSLLAAMAPGRQSSCGLVAADCWLENYEGSDSWRVREEVCTIGSWGHLVLLTELPEGDEDPETLEEHRAEADLLRRRQSFRLY